MTTLADLNTTPEAKPDLKDFGPWASGQPKPSVVNADTASNMAAHAAVLAPPDAILSTYNNVNTELTTGNSSFTMDQLLAQRAQLDQKSTYDTLERTLADPGVSPEDKAAYMNGYVGMSVDHPGKQSLGVTVARAAAATASSPNESNEAIKTIIPSDGSVYDAVDAYNGWIQKKINIEAQAGNNEEWANKAADIVTTLVPFLNQISTTHSIGQMGMIKNPGDLVRSLTLLGEGKNDVRAAIDAMPLDQKYGFAQKVIDAVKSSTGGQSRNPNMIARMGQLDDFLNGSGYGGNDRLTDNIFSILDDTIIAGPLKSLLKGGAEAVRATAAVKRAALIEEAAPEVEKVVKQLQITHDKSSGPTIFVNQKGEASSAIGDVQPPHQDVTDAAAELVAQNIVAKFNKQNLKTATGDMADVAAATPKLDLADLHQNVVDRVKSILTPDTYNDPEIVKKIVNGVGDELAARLITTPKTYKATASQLVRQVMDDSNASRLATRTTVDHTTVSQTVKNFNPEKARAIFRMMRDDPTGQVAKVMYGTTYPEALANDLLPEVKNIDGSVRNKVNMVANDAAPDHTVLAGLQAEKGRIDLTPEEKASMRKVATDDFTNVVGMVPRTAMATVGDNSLSVASKIEAHDAGVKFDMVYGPTDGGFSSAVDARYQATFALKKYGVTDSEIELLGLNKNGTYAPAVDGQKYDSFLVRVKHNYEFTPTDQVEHTFMPGSKWNMFDSRTNFTAGKGGSLPQHFIPPSVTVPATIFNSSSRAADRAAWIDKSLTDLLSSYGKKYKAVDARQQALISDYIVEANNKGLKFDPVNLEARGFSPASIDALRDWKTTTDTMWWLENVDANKTARAKGWSKFVDRQSDTDLMVRALPNRFGQGVEVFDTSKGMMVTLTKSEVDELYAKGGSIAATRDVAEHNGKSFDRVLVQNDKAGSYIRALRDDDATLAYRDGYYPIKYTDTYFIRKTLKKADGSTYEKAIASAGSLSDANALRNRMVAQDGGIYNIDYSKASGDRYDENSWSQLVSSGRSAQRVRGERLADANKITDLNHVHVESPEDSVVQSIRSLSQRTAFRDWIDTTKTRWMAQYSHLLDDVKGQKMWPEDARTIGEGKLQFSNKEVADAKATWRHVRTMESGYINLIDDASKNFFKNMANTAGGSKSWKWMEGPLLAASKVGPTGFARGKAFRLLLAANPLRQAPVQAMQSLPILLATNPLGIPKIAAQSILLDFMKLGGDAPTFFKVASKLTTGLSEKEAAELYAHYQAAGFDAAVDANSLIRNQIATIVDRSLLGKVKSAVAKPLNIGQKYGFNAGEDFLMRTVWLSEVDVAKRAGLKLTPATMDNIVARVRNLTGNMNKAGELPYNENALSMALQFFQAPHKTFAQIFMGHRGLTGLDRIKLAAAYVTTFGVGLSPITSMLSNALPKGSMDPATTELIEGGLFNLAMNAALSNLFHDTVRTDFSDSFRLLPNPVQDYAAMWHGMMQTGIGSVISSGASVGLVIGDNARVSNFVKQMMRVFTVPADKKPEEASATGIAFLNMFSGLSNYFKAQYALEHQKTISATGTTVDYHVNGVEAWLKAAGFSTIDEIHQYASNSASYLADQAYKDDIAHIVDTTTRTLARKGISQDETGWYLDMMAEAQVVYKNDPIYMQEFSKQIMYKAKKGENSIFDTLLKQTGYTSPSEFANLVSMSHLDERAKQILLDSKDQFEKMKKENEDNYVKTKGGS